MSQLGQRERVTQDRVLKLFKEELGYDYLGDWSRRADNRQVEEAYLSDWLRRRGASKVHINGALQALRHENGKVHSSLYDRNQAVYELLRYGVKVKPAPGQPTDTVHLVDWNEPLNNDFQIAEEVTLRGGYERRPDIVFYVNGIAIAVLELKNSRTDVGVGIRQNLSNQAPEHNQWFFSTVQLVMAGNDTEGLRYGTIGTPEKFFLTWKEDESDNSRYKLDKYLLKLFDKKRLIELMRDFVVFDAGEKKLPRPHQYFAVKAAQEHVERRESGIIWHTQGSGKSLVMVMLARWILENKPTARVVIITDRTELDQQIQGVFEDAGETIERSSSGLELKQQLGQAKPRLMCSLIHKFGRTGRKEGESLKSYLKNLRSQPVPTFGDLFVFVDECHRTQGGDLNRVMKAMLPEAVFFGFTGTPLLAKDHKSSREVFGNYIHVYNFKEGVEDGIVLDLIYEARDIDQELGSEEHIDAWFEAKTEGLNPWQKQELKSKWGTLQNVLSSKSRMDRVVADIIFDFTTKTRLKSHRGNAILVASSIYEACKYFTLLQKTPFKGKCAVVTSYNPQQKDVKLEEIGANTESDKQFVFNTYQELLKDVIRRPKQTATETYEQEARDLFKKQPANMKLLVVVDKLLTGFDAPPCTYIYVDKSMQDHSLFQAICRVNRLDGEDKEYGYIVDYKDLFKKVEKAIAVYTSQLAHDENAPAPEILLKDRLVVGRERLDNALEALALLCEPVQPPRTTLEYGHYFCGNTEVHGDLEERQPQRVALYRGTVALLRAYDRLAFELEEAGYSPTDIAHIKERLKHYTVLRDEVRRMAGEVLDLKPYEADMRHLIDTYIEAKLPKKISPFDDNTGLLELIVNTGIANAIDAQPDGLRGSKTAMAEAIENNIRRKIVREHLNDPAYYEKMSRLLDELIAARKARALEYEQYLKEVDQLARDVQGGQDRDVPEQLRDRPGALALYHSLAQIVRDQEEMPEIEESHQAQSGTAQPATSSEAAMAAEAPRAEYDADLGDATSDGAIYRGHIADSVESLAERLDRAVKQHRPADWRGVRTREQAVQRAMFDVLGSVDLVQRLFPIVKAQMGEY